jgi:c-di-GMP-related signal transduction protein
MDERPFVYTRPPTDKMMDDYDEILEASKVIIEIMEHFRGRNDITNDCISLIKTKVQFIDWSRRSGYWSRDKED